jgi:hypothetical protein
MLKKRQKNMKDWKDDILKSIKGMGKAQPPVHAFDQILQRINNQDEVKSSSKGWLTIAATVSLVVLFNAYFIVSYSSGSDATAANNTDVYSSLVSNYNLYEND